MTTQVSQQQTQTLIVIGGGAAGFFCAVNAARLNTSLRVILLEKTTKLLSKVRISGGGRCNVTHALFDITEMSKRYPRGLNFVKKSFHDFFTTDTVRWFEERNVKLKTEADGRMFPQTDSSQTIISCLLNEANLYQVDIRMNSEVKHIIKKEASFDLTLSNGQRMMADYVCIACGGYPKSAMFRWLLDLGHTISDPVPSLFTFNLSTHGQQKHPITKLMGVSVEHARIKVEGTKLSQEGPVLITHWGLSGPAVLRTSAWGARQLAAIDYQFKVHINWVILYNEQRLKDEIRNLRSGHISKKISNHNITGLPNRLWQFLLDLSNIKEDMKFSDLSSKAENLLIRNLVDFVVEVNGKTTFKDEFVTAGGISLSEVDASTMMSKKIENLFFAGEILDVDGITGGFNFQHAWTSGFLAAKSIARMV